MPSGQSSARTSRLGLGCPGKCMPSRSMYSRSDHPALGMSGVMESRAGSDSGTAALTHTKKLSRSKAKVCIIPRVLSRAVLSYPTLTRYRPPWVTISFEIPLTPSFFISMKRRSSMGFSNLTMLLSNFVFSVSFSCSNAFIIHPLVLYPLRSYFLTLPPVHQRKFFSDENMLLSRYRVRLCRS